MIPSIEDIFKMLSEGVISFDQAEAWVRSHVAASEDTAMLRDVFGGLAMLGLLARGDTSGRPAIAEYAYTMADTMLEARAK